MVVQQDGYIKLVLDGAAQPTPFLDAHTSISFCGERGLFSIAFARDHATSRRFYVYYTDPSGNIRIDELLRDANDPNVADPSTRPQVIVVPHPTGTRCRRARTRSRSTTTRRFTTST